MEKTRRYEHLINAPRVQGETNPVKRWENSDKKSRSLAIKAKCAQCMGCDVDWLETGFKADIKNCTDKSCAIYIFRPYQGKKDDNQG